jgi:hypothetical protein
MHIKVEGTNFVKDTGTNALLMTGRAGLTENEARKRLSNNLNIKSHEINNIKEQIDNLNSDLSEIKELLKTLLVKEK